ncbi:MAG: HpcH/HpaI aldolase/citrate lyase family protein [Granulosicoccaceae bacterium]
MKHPVNSFTHAIRNGEKQIGLWVSLASEISADIVASSGYDWVVLDMEHSPNEIPSILTQLNVFDNSGTTAIVRPAWNDTVEVKRLLDIGSPGLLFPMVQSVEEAEAAVRATRYPPLGVRGVAGSTRASRYGRCKDYFDRVEEETTIIVQLETKQAIDQAEAIAAVDGVHGVFFGPSDIAADLGLLGQPMNTEVWDLILPVADKLSKNGVPCGTLVLDSAKAAELLKGSFTFVACGVDSALFTNSVDQLLADVKSNL